jgi:hypothetical protein
LDGGLTEAACEGYLEHELPRLFEAVPLQNMGKNLHPA